MKILCVGKNYAAHATELGDPSPTSPIWFWKPPSSILGPGGTIRIPPGEVHHEVEWALRIGSRGVPEAMTIAIDVTARGEQAVAKKAGQPWARAKGYDTFLPLGPWVKYAQGPHRLTLRVNGELRQDGSTGDMTWDLAALLADASRWTSLEAGDILLTGTPAGVGPIKDGDFIEASLVGHVEASFHVRPRAAPSSAATNPSA